MEGAVYLLCAATALAGGVLLLRGYGRSRTRLLLWCGLCFLALALENVILFVDRELLPETDLTAERTAVALAGVLLLLYGLVWETE
ncbi:MAG TPA: DUF5985 family protein [Gemmataceae bacterium]